MRPVLVVRLNRVVVFDGGDLHGAVFTTNVHVTGAAFAAGRID